MPVNTKPFPPASAVLPEAAAVPARNPVGVAPVAPQSVEASWRILLGRLEALRSPRIIGEPDGEDLRDIAEHMIEVADAIDTYFEQLGRMVQGNAPVKIDIKLFQHPCFDAIGGNATWEINRAAEALDEDRLS